MRPQNANPQNFIHNGNIIFTSPAGHFSIAKGIWKENGVSTERLAMRWNGEITDPNDKGYPRQGAHPLWFQLPDDVREVKDIVKTIIDHGI